MGRIWTGPWRDLHGLGEGVLSLSVVPVGLTKYNLGRPCAARSRGTRPGNAIEQVDRFRETAMRDRGVGWCYAADELYLIAQQDLPEDSPTTTRAP